MIELFTKKKEAGFKAKIEELAKENAELKASIDALKNSDAITAMAKLEVDYKELTSKYNDAVAKYEAAVSDVAKLTADNGTLVDEVAKLKESNKSAMQHALDIVASQGVPTVNMEADQDKGFIIRHKSGATVINRLK